MTPSRSPARQRRPPSAQRGAALLLAMTLLALVASLAAGMVWQQWRAVQVESAERSRGQSTWILAGALDWSRFFLREDVRSGTVDHAGEPWATPLAEARLSSFLAADREASKKVCPYIFTNRIPVIHFCPPPPVVTHI
jgi:general secretion pathway protein K